MKHFEEELSAYISDDLDTERQGEVESHLKKCESCSRELVRLQELAKLLVSVQERNPSRDFKTRVVNSVRHNPANTRNRQWIMWLAAAAAVTIMALILKPEPAEKPAAKIHKTIPVTKPVGSQDRVSLPKEQKPNEVMPAAKEKRPEPSQTQEALSSEEVQLIANLDALENMDLIVNYEDVDHLETALIAEDEDDSQ